MNDTTTSLFSSGDSIAENHRLFTHNPSPLLIHGQHEGKILAANRAAAKLYNYSEEELQQKPFTHLLQESSEEIYEQSVSLSEDQFHHSEVLTQTTKDGVSLRVILLSIPMNYEGRSAVLTKTVCVGGTAESSRDD